MLITSILTSSLVWGTFEIREALDTRFNTEMTLIRAGTLIIETSAFELAPHDDAFVLGHLDYFDSPLLFGATLSTSSATRSLLRIV